MTEKDIEQEHDPYELRAPGGRLSDCVHRSLPSRSVLPLPSYTRRIGYAPGTTLQGRGSILFYDAEFMRRASAIEEELALACVSSKRRSALELSARLVEAAELGEEVAAHGGQEVVAPESRFGGERIDERQPLRRTEGHRHRDRAIQLDDGGGRELGERIVERRDARPVRLRRGARSRVAGGDRGLECIGTEPAAELLGALERGQTAAHEQVIPARAVLIGEQDRLSRRADPRERARRLYLHERDQAVNFRFLRNELGHDASEAQRLLAEGGPHPVLARGRRVAFVENEVNDL